MHPQDHIGSPIDLAGIGVGGDIAEKPIKTRHGGEGRGCLFAGEGAGGGKDATVHAASVVQQVAAGYLYFLMLGRGCWGRGVSASRGLGGPGSVGGGNIDGE
jgi:hypothetical protein